MAKTKKQIDLPELLTRLQTLNFNIHIVEKELKDQIDGVQKLFGLSESELKQKLNTYLTQLEYWLNISFQNKIVWFKTASRQIKKLGDLN